jgi:hypothetical protein
MAGAIVLLNEWYCVLWSTPNLRLDHEVTIVSDATIWSVK